MKRAVLLALMLALMGVCAPYAQSSEGGVAKRFSLGYHGIITGDFAQSISSRVWLSEDLGIEGNLYFARIGVTAEREVEEWVNVNGDWTRRTYTEKDEYSANLFALTAKAMYAPVVKDNSKFYLGVELGFGRASAQADSEEFDDGTSLFTFSPLMGAEYRFSELPELGFDWEVGYRLNYMSVDEIDLSLGSISTAFGVHYYF